MKKVTMVIAVILVGVAVYLFAKTKTHPKVVKTASDDSVLEQDPLEPTPSQPLHQLAAEVKTPALKSDQMSTHCLEFSQAVADKEVKEVIELLKKQTISLGSQCINDFSQDFPKDMVQNLISRCQPLALSNREAECLNFLELFQFSIRGAPYDESDLRTLSAGELARLFFFRFFSNKHSSLKNVSSELLERQPGSPNVNKAHFLAMIVDTDTDFQKSGEMNESMLKQLKRARQLNPKDPELFEFELLSLKDNTALLTQKIQEFIRLNPQSGLGDYYLAASIFNKGDKNQAISHLEQATQKEPKNNRFSESLSKLRAGEAKAFNIQLGLDPKKL